MYGITSGLCVFIKMVLLRLPVKMAACSVLPDNSANSILKHFESFEDKVKERLKWSQQKWIESGESEYKLKKVTNSVKYWSMKLARAQGEKNVIIGLYNENRNVSLSLMNVVDKLDELGFGMKLEGYTNFRNPRYISISFDTIETKQMVKNSLRSIGDSDVIYLEWAQEVIQTVVKVHWVPREFPVKSIVTFLEKYVKVNEHVREENKLMDGRRLSNGTVTFTTELKPSVTLKDVPHLCDIEGLEFLINITGRPLLCLNCELLGHKSKECKTPYCTTCRRLQPKTHQCIEADRVKKTYAAVVDECSEIDHEGKISYEDPKSKSVLSKEDIERRELAKSFWNPNSLQQASSQKDKVQCKEDKREDGDNVLSGSWADNDQSESEGSGAEDTQNGDEQNAVHCIKQYIDELQNLKKQITPSAFGDSESTLLGADSHGEALALKPMDIDVISTKRKIGVGGDLPTGVMDDFPMVAARASSNRGNRSYSKKRGGLMTIAGSFTSENLFQKLIDEQQQK